MESNKMDQFLREKLDNGPDAVPDEWNRISTRVSFMNFFKFGLHHYNIYYTLAVIASLVGIMSAVFAINLKQNYTAENKTNPARNIEKINPKHENTIMSNSIEYSKKTEISKTYNQRGLQKAEEKKLNSLENIIANEIVSVTENLVEIAINSKQKPLLALESRKTGMLGTFSTVTIKENVHAVFSQRKWFLEIYSQPVSSEAMIINASGSNASFESQKTRQAYGVLLGMKTFKWWFQSGIEFSYLSSNFSNSFIRNEISQIKSYEVFTRVVYGLESGKELQTIKDSVLIVSEKALSTRYSVNHLNSYKFLEIPVSVGYVLHFKKFNIVNKAGLVFDVYKNAKGTISTVDQTADLSSVSFYKSYFTLYSSIGFYYKVNPFMNFVFEPNLKYNINGKTPERAFFIEKNNFAGGIKIGLAVDF